MTGKRGRETWSFVGAMNSPPISTQTGASVSHSTCDDGSNDGRDERFCNGE